MNQNGKEFVGYPPPTSNTIYCPNQFFDVVVPNYSRGVIRLVGYLIRQSLGWSDAHGNPMNEQIQVSYSDLIHKAGISRGAIRKALDEALDGNLIVEVQKGQPNKAGSKSSSACYELRWDDREEYIKDINDFQGFFSGNGNLTYIPNAFFDYTIRHEKLCVVKVVGSILRFTIGYQTRKGFRRRQVKMSVSQIKEYAHTPSTNTIDRGIKEAMEKGHLIRLSAGFFDRNGGKNSEAAEYTIHWNDRAEYNPDSFSKPITKSNGSKMGTEISTKTVQKWERGQSKNGNGSNGSKMGTETVQKKERERFKNGNGLYINNKSNNIPKQQQQDETPEKPAVAAKDFLVGILTQNGFDQATANRFAIEYPTELIENQCKWLAIRNPTRNPAGLLRRSIEENWPAPEIPNSKPTLDEIFVSAWYAQLGGNENGSVAPATTSDVRSCTRFIESWQKLDPTKDVEKMAREFASWIDRTEQMNSPARRSLKFSLSRFGDRFISDMRKRLEIIQRNRIEKLKEAHLERNLPNYHTWVSDRESWLSEKHPEAFQRFKEEDQDRRERLLKNPYISDAEMRERFLRTHDSKADYICRLVTHFTEGQNASPVLLPPFWVWDREFNKESFNPNPKPVEVVR